MKKKSLWSSDSKTRNLILSEYIYIILSYSKYICVNQTWDFENLKIGQHDLKIDQFSDQS